MKLPKLDGFLKLWIKAKVFQLYRTDPYLKHLQVDIALSHFIEALSEARTTDAFLKDLEKFDFSKGIKFSRKGDGVSFFEYPSIGFQVKSLLELWPSICRVYKDQNLLSHKNRFGHRPHLSSDFSEIERGSTISDSDIKINCSLKIPFTEDYPQFKEAAVSQARAVLEDQESGSVCVLVIQSDIEKFFHKLTLSGVQSFLKEYYPGLSKTTSALFSELSDKFSFKSLPIGWLLSGVFADLICAKFHESLQRSMKDDLKKRIASADVAAYIAATIPSAESRENFGELLKKFIESANVTYRSTANYVDDFIFNLQFTVSEQFKDKKLVKSLEKVVAYLFLDIAEKKFNALFPEKMHIKFYRPDEDKGKHFSFDKDNIDTLGSNFFNIDNNIPYDPDEPNLWTRLDEFLLPTDNDLTLNEKTQFFVHLANLRHKVLEGERLSAEQRDDVFSKILLKLKGPEAKYVASVMRLLDVLMISEPDVYTETCLDMILNIKNQFERSGKTLDLWLRFFSSYYKIFSKRSGNNSIKFFDDFDTFIAFWSKNNGTSDDIDLLNGIRAGYLLESSLLNSATTQIEVMTRKKKGYGKTSGFSSQFFAFSASRNKPIKLFVNQSFDATSAAMFVRLASRHQTVSVTDYLGIASKIGQRLGPEAVARFVSLSAVNVVPRWNEDDVSTFSKGLADISSKVFQSIFNRLLRTASYQWKSIGRTYAHRLNHAQKTFAESDELKIPNIPKAYGSGDKDAYRSVVFYLMTLQSNSLSDLRRAYLSAIVPIDNYRDFSFFLSPYTLQISGLLFRLLIEKVANFPRKEFTGKAYFQLANKELVREQKKRKAKNSFQEFQLDGVSHVNLRDIHDHYSKQKKLLLTLCPIGFDAEKDFDQNFGLRFSSGIAEKVNLSVESAIYEAKRRGSDLIVFPELCLPRRYLRRYLNLCGSYGITLIAGVEYVSDHSNLCRNATVISFPTFGNKGAYGSPYTAFEQNKHFPAAEERHDLEKGGKYKYNPGSTLYVFSSKRFGDLAVLMCSDFLSLRLRLKLQEKIQTVFVPAQNFDTTTYNHIAESSIRDLHCVAVVCNNQKMGASFVYAPLYRKNERVIFNKEGAAQPEFLTFSWNPASVLPSQGANSQRPFRFKDKADKSLESSELSIMKQTPPDWGY